MAKNFKIKRNKTKTWLSKAIKCVILPAYFSFLAILSAVTLILTQCNLSETVTLTAAIVYVVLLLAVSYSLLLIVIPRCRVKQAMLDFENYDFSPYTPSETEVFSHTEQTEKYYFTLSPFDDDEGVTELFSGKALDDYFEQFAPERLKCVEELRARGGFIPILITDFSEEYFEGAVEKRCEGEYVTVTVTEKHEITFTDEHIRIGGKAFTYGQCEASVNAEFFKPYTCINARLNLLINEEYMVSFAFGTRIMSLIDKHRIPVKNHAIADYILADPKNAFRRIGLRGKLKKRPHTRGNNKIDYFYR